jgi:hypothetical protein
MLYSGTRALDIGRAGCMTSVSQPVAASPVTRDVDPTAYTSRRVARPSDKGDPVRGGIRSGAAHL